MLAKFKTALVLLCIGALSGGLIYSVNELTKETIADNELNRKIGFYSEIFSIEEGATIVFEDCTEDESLVTENSNYYYNETCPSNLTETRILSETQEVLGYVYFSREQNSYGEVSVLVGIGLDGSLKQVVISGSTNTPNFVKLIERDYLSPFSGVNLEDVSFDSSTGATYTYSSVKSAVEQAIEFYQAERGEE